MTTETTRRALFGGAGLAALAVAAPALSAALPPPTKMLNRHDWDKGMAKLAGLWERDRQICSHRAVAEPAGTWTDADEIAWNDSSDDINMMDWEMFEMDAPDFAALDWKIKMLADHDLIQEDWAEQLRADIKRLSSMEGR